MGQRHQCESCSLYGVRRRTARNSHSASRVRFSSGQGFFLGDGRAGSRTPVAVDGRCNNQSNTVSVSSGSRIRARSESRPGKKHQLSISDFSTLQVSDGCYESSVNVGVGRRGFKLESEPKSGILSEEGQSSRKEYQLLGSSILA